MTIQYRLRWHPPRQLSPYRINILHFQAHSKASFLFIPIPVFYICYIILFTFQYEIHRNIYWKMRWERQHSRPGHRWKNNNKMKLKEIG